MENYKLYKRELELKVKGTAWFFKTKQFLLLPSPYGANDLKLEIFSSVTFSNFPVTFEANYSEIP